MLSETSFNELTLAPCQSSPDIELPDLNDVAVGVKRGPESPACAFRGDVILTLYADDDPADIASSGESNNSTLHPVISV